MFFPLPHVRSFSSGLVGREDRILYCLDTNILYSFKLSRVSRVARPCPAPGVREAACAWFWMCHSPPFLIFASSRKHWNLSVSARQAWKALAGVCGPGTKRQWWLSVEETQSPCFVFLYFLLARSLPTRSALETQRAILLPWSPHGEWWQQVPARVLPVVNFVYRLWRFLFYEGLHGASGLAIRKDENRLGAYTCEFFQIKFKISVFSLIYFLIVKLIRS